MLDSKGVISHKREGLTDEKQFFATNRRVETLEDAMKNADVFLGPSMVFTNVTNPRSGVNRRGQYSKTTVKRGASIGANSTIVCGHDIGEFAFIGAGAVVTKNVLPYALLVGNPARQIGWMSEYGYRLEFDLDGFAICPESKSKYQLISDKVVKL